MNVAELKASGQVMFETVVGSHAYGTSTPKSDMDIRGVFLRPLAERVTLFQLPDEVGHEKPEDVKFYELEKFMSLAKDCNPNIIEFLFMPEDCVRFCDDRFRRLIAERDAFVSKKAYHTFSGYAYAQIKRAKGENKWVNNPKPKEPPKREDFCWVIPAGRFSGVLGAMPARPESLKDVGLNLAEYHVAAMERVSDTYRLYRYGSASKGVFRNGNLVCESIPLEDEVSRFVGLLVYNDHEYQKAMLDWKNYWTWVKERNPERWVSQERGEVDYDCKSMQHCMRLLLSGESILRTGKPIVRFEGEQLQYLRDIRNGKFTHEQLMADVEKRMAVLEVIEKESSLPWGADVTKIDGLFKELVMQSK